ncbi:unnamed protein product [Rhizoctonia solani]|uniref:Uncharacterized protein n=1 Tax=Rhizoctonia solani TaxID=456999 RepID=A0A8H3C6D8_9AGAM|nr:unnamed protein product [Rhizoctonia solani]
MLDMANNVPGATVPTAGGTAACHGSAKFSEGGICDKDTPAGTMLKAKSEMVDPFNLVPASHLCRETRSTAAKK